MCFDLHSMGVPKILYHLQALKSTEMIMIMIIMMNIMTHFVGMPFVIQNKFQSIIHSKE